MVEKKWELLEKKLELLEQPPSRAAVVASKPASERRRDGIAVAAVRTGNSADIAVPLTSACAAALANSNSSYWGRMVNQMESIADSCCPDDEAALGLDWPLA